MDKILNIFMSVVCVLIVVWFVGVLFTGYKTINFVQENGIKGLVESIWCGEQTKDCNLNIQEYL